MLCKGCFRTCLWSPSLAFVLNNLTLSLMDCQESVKLRCNMGYFAQILHCANIEKSRPLWLQIFHWVCDFTLLVTPVGAREAIIVNEATASVFSLAFWCPSASMCVVLVFDEDISRAVLLFSQLILFSYSFRIPVHLQLLSIVVCHCLALATERCL